MRPSTQQNGITRRTLTQALAGIVALPVGVGATAGGVANEAVENRSDVSQSDTESLNELSQEYVAALDAGNRTRVNELIANGGDISLWSAEEFEWIRAFDFEFVTSRTVETRSSGVIGDVELRIGGNKGTMRYWFKENNNDRLLIWESIAGLRTGGEISPKGAADAYFSALDEGDRSAANDVISSEGELEIWSAEEFVWVDAFTIELKEFSVTHWDDSFVTANLAVQIGETTKELVYEFRQAENTEWKLWRARSGLR